MLSSRAGLVEDVRLRVTDPAPLALLAPPSFRDVRQTPWWLRVVDLPISVAGAWQFAEDYEGWARFLVDEDRRTVIGACFAGPDVAELLQSATIAVVGEVPLERLWHAIPSVPTVSEIWLRFLEAYGL